MIRSTHFQSGGFERVGSSPSIIYLKDIPFINLKEYDILLKIMIISHKMKAVIIWTHQKNATNLVTKLVD